MKRLIVKKKKYSSKFLESIYSYSSPNILRIKFKWQTYEFQRIVFRIGNSIKILQFGYQKKLRYFQFSIPSTRVIELGFQKSRLNLVFAYHQASFCKPICVSSVFE